MTDGPPAEDADRDALRQRLEREDDFWKKQYEPRLAPTPAQAAAVPAPAADTQSPSSWSLALAFLAGAVVALLGGLAWAVVVIATRYDIGFLAVLVGVGTGLAVQLVARGPVGTFERALAGVFA